jgi:RNA-splicing ligase RtcB
MEIYGKYNFAKVFASIIDDETIQQIRLLCDQKFVSDSKIRIMPDCHKGNGCTIGFTMNIADKICPNLVGVDIGCGIFGVNLDKSNVNYENLDKIIREFIPSGKNVHKDRTIKFPQLQNLKCYRELRDTHRIERSIGSLGGGNHFISIEGNYLLIHSGSRNLGQQVARYYQNLAIDLCAGKEDMYKEITDTISEYKQTNRRNKISTKIKQIRDKYNELTPHMPRDLCYLSGEYSKDYLHDMYICQEYAELNRRKISEIILQKLFSCKIDDFQTIDTKHNYICPTDNILRKGAISANQDELILIPINMRDGTIIANGKGNSDWNMSAPHGAGRILSRTQAKSSLLLSDFQNSMKEVFTTSVSSDTIDESPMAYKPIEAILSDTQDTAEVVEILKPKYNFKAN